MTPFQLVILILAIGGVLPIAAAVLIIVLVCFRKTRLIGGIPVGLGAVLFLLTFAWFTDLQPQHVSSPRTRPRVARQHRSQRQYVSCPSRSVVVSTAPTASPDDSLDIRPTEPAEAEIPRKAGANRNAHPAAEAESTPPGRVNRPPQAAGDVYRMNITIGPYTTRAECDAKLPEEVQNALNQYVEMCLGAPLPAGAVVPESEFRQAIVKDQREEVRQYSVGPMVSLHVLLEFDRSVKERSSGAVPPSNRRPANLGSRRRPGFASCRVGRVLRLSKNRS